LQTVPLSLHEKEQEMLVVENLEFVRRREVIFIRIRWGAATREVEISGDDMRLLRTLLDKAEAARDNARGA